jgi:phosphotransferase system  glucose/maltose/N-acetylglucosamine-specific IIC component
MSDLERRGSYTPRRVREQRAYRLATAGGVAGLVTVVGAVIALVSSLSWSIPVIAAVIAVICFVMFRRLIGPS